MKRRGFLVSMVALAFTDKVLDTLAATSNRNTQALRELTAAMLNAPSGYRGAMTGLVR